MIDRSKILVAFDLDDTLYKECDYVMSGYRHVAGVVAHELGINPDAVWRAMNAGSGTEHPFDALHAFVGGAVSVYRMVALYREHEPAIELPDSSRRCLDELKNAGVTLALITDGRHTGQWNKIKALGLERYFSNRLISVSADVGADKNAEMPWLRMQELTAGCTVRWYVGDNPRKDFMHPNRLGWHTVMLADDGRNIKSQNVELPDCYFASRTIGSLESLPSIILEKNI